MYSQSDFMTDTFIDERDDNQYEIILIDSIWWFNQNLRFRAPYADCYKDIEAFCALEGRLYDYRNIAEVCPSGWSLPSIRNFENLLLSLPGTDHREATTFIPYTWDSLFRCRVAGFNLDATGFKHKRKYMPLTSLNFWLADADHHVNHVHMYEDKNKKTKQKQLMIFWHHHEKYNAIKEKRKFAVRCVKTGL